MYDADPHFPDGLTESAIDALIASVAQEIADEALETNAPVPTSRLRSSTAASRRQAHRATRRVARQSGAAVVRLLPLAAPVTTVADDAASQRAA